MTEDFIGTPIDLTVIVVYFLGILAFGSYFARYTKTTADFFFAGQRFAWWLVAFSFIATTVGSYSFIKYSEAAFTYGLASTQSYTNDWMWMPLLVLGWIPIIYYQRIRSIPEYFERRFGTINRGLYTSLLLLYMLGYVGINLYTLGIAVHALMPSVTVLQAAIAVACFTAIYVTAGGQSSVIMTDLAQACLLLAAGFLIFFGGLYQLGGFENFWTHVPPESRHSLGEFSGKSNLSFVKIFWQDGMANSFAFWFVNQGMVLRFLSARSERDAKKAVLFNALILMPIASFAVCNAGLLGRAMDAVGMFPDGIEGSDAFVVVSNMVTFPGLFGLIMAALVAALMSTADTLVNGMSAIAINDIWRPYLLPNRSDRFYLNLARVHCILIMAIGLSLVPLFDQFKTIYDAHGAFTASVTPPLVVSLFLAIVWRRFNRVGAMSVLVLGTLMVGYSLYNPYVIQPFAHGVIPDESAAPYKMFKYMRACYGLAVCLGVGILGNWIGALFNPSLRLIPDDHLSLTSRLTLMGLYKGSAPNTEKGETVLSSLDKDENLQEDEVQVPHAVAERMKAKVGDLIYIEDERRWLGGLKSVHAKLAGINDSSEKVQISSDLLDRGHFDLTRRVRVSKVF
ncbi:MAG: sodium:solute symporter family protein [Candidatus Omnitrophica bacterium]|nr:sodium:solute symporter family protein [Candidatus Omnitrophota bacterium]